MQQTKEQRTLIQEIFEEEQQKLFHFAYRIVQDEAMAEEVMRQSLQKLKERFDPAYCDESRENLARYCTVLVDITARELAKRVS